MSTLKPIPINPPSDELLSWIARITGASDLTARYPDPPGRSRDIWLIEGRRADGSEMSCVVRHESGAGPWTGTSFTLAREGAVLRALAGTGVPVPNVFGVSGDGDTLAIERLAGTAHFEFENDAQRVQTIDAFLKALVALHTLPVKDLDLPMPTPKSAREHALLDLADYQRSYLRCPKHPDVDAAFAWLEKNAPTTMTRTSLLQGDAGPGNFLHLHGRITGLVDWEAAHVGDPMDDLAWLWFRKCFLKRDTDLGYWYTRYAELSGIPIDLKLISYYRVQVLTRAAVAVLTRQEYEEVKDPAKVKLMVGLVRSVLRDPFGELNDPDALPPLTSDANAKRTQGPS